MYINELIEITNYKMYILCIYTNNHVEGQVIHAILYVFQNSSDFLRTQRSEDDEEQTFN